MAAEVLNEVTGEAVLTDKAGHKYHVVFDLDAVLAVEKITGKTAVQLMTGQPGATDCICLILAGSAGWARRNPGAPRINENLARKIFADSGGLRLGPALSVSLSCAEGLGLDDNDEEADSGPLVSPSS